MWILVCINTTLNLPACFNTSTLLSLTFIVQYNTSSFVFRWKIGTLFILLSWNFIALCWDFVEHFCRIFLFLSFHFWISGCRFKSFWFFFFLLVIICFFLVLFLAFFLSCLLALFLNDLYVNLMTCFLVACIYFTKVAWKMANWRAYIL